MYEKRRWCASANTNISMQMTNCTLIAAAQPYVQPSRASPPQRWATTNTHARTQTSIHLDHTPACVLTHIHLRARHTNKQTRTETHKRRNASTLYTRANTYKPAHKNTHARKQKHMHNHTRNTRTHILKAGRDLVRRVRQRGFDVADLRTSNKTGHAAPPTPAGAVTTTSPAISTDCLKRRRASSSGHRYLDLERGGVDGATHQNVKKTRPLTVRNFMRGRHRESSGAST